MRDTSAACPAALEWASSVSGFNLTNHFNALAVHANVDDPQYGIFFGNYHIRYRADFDVLF